MAVAPWTFQHALPNLHLREGIGNEFIAIWPYNDPRIDELRIDPRVTALLDNFTDAFSEPVAPSVLVVRRGSLRHNGFEALIAFRNLIALNAIAFGCQFRLRHQNTRGPLWSDFFDLYPITLGAGNMLVVQSPAILGLEDTTGFKGQCSPTLPPPVQIDVRFDTQLLNVLLAEWHRAFIQAQLSDWKLTCLFRSLQMAFQASRIPFYNSGIHVDYGTRLALWVSAFECLTHPKTAKTDLKTVLALLALAGFKRQDLKDRKYPANIKNVQIQLTLVEELYRHLYSTRNDYLHGNPVTPEALLAFRTLGHPPLLLLAPLIYRHALFAFIFGGQPQQAGSDLAYEIITRRDFEDSLAKATATQRRW